MVSRWCRLRYLYPERSLPFRVINAVSELLELGPVRGAYRIGHELLERTGLVERLRPSFRITDARYELLCALPDAGDLQAFHRWWQDERPGFFVGLARAYHPHVADTLGARADSVIARADRALCGAIRCFGHWPGDYGEPLNWYLNPDTGAEWPRDEHGSRSRRHLKRLGSWKYPWELGRCPQVYDWVRAYALTGDERYAAAFFELVASFERECPFRQGIQWTNGQEVAIRCLTWLYALYALADAPSCTPERLRLVCRQLAFHLVFVRENLNYSRFAVYNNHLIGEALCLYVGGALMPWLRASSGLCALGRRLLASAVVDQFSSDGGYVQNSNNYERLALHYCIWAALTARQRGEDLGSAFWERLAQARDLLLQQQAPDGRLPNYGANDGALLNPWTECDYADFRPLLASLTYLLEQKRIYPPGPWDEELLWFFGPEAAKSPLVAEALGSASYPLAGLHIVRQNESNYCLFRCGPLRERFGWGNQLHVDLWWRGHNVLLGSGSYCYLSPWFRWFGSTRSQNTLLVNGEGQTIPYRDFKSLIKVEGQMLETVDDRGDKRVAGEHRGYLRFPEQIVHRRAVESLGDGGWRIEDDVARQVDWPTPTELALHWLLPDWPYELLDREQALLLRTPAGPLRMSWSERNQGEPLRAMVLRASEQPMGGWVSRYYFRKSPALSLLVTCSALASLCIHTELEPGECTP